MLEALIALSLLGLAAVAALHQREDEQQLLSERTTAERITSRAETLFRLLSGPDGESYAAEAQANGAVEIPASALEALGRPGLGHRLPTGQELRYLATWRGGLVGIVLEVGPGPSRASAARILAVGGPSLGIVDPTASQILGGGPQSLAWTEPLPDELAGNPLEAVPGALAASTTMLRPPEEADRFIWRAAVSGAATQNRMAAPLDLAGNRLVSPGRIDAQQLAASTLEAPTLQVAGLDAGRVAAGDVTAGHLAADSLRVSGSLSAAGASTGAVSAEGGVALAGGISAGRLVLSGQLTASGLEVSGALTAGGAADLGNLDSPTLAAGRLAAASLDSGRLGARSTALQALGVSGDASLGSLEATGPAAGSAVGDLSVIGTLSTPSMTVGSGGCFGCR